MDARHRGRTFLAARLPSFREDQGMVRRLFVSALSSVVALAASAVYSKRPAKAQTAPPNMRMLHFPEPEPIVVDPAIFERARTLLDAVARGTFDRSELAPELNASVPPSNVRERGGAGQRAWRTAVDVCLPKVHHCIPPGFRFAIVPTT